MSRQPTKKYLVPPTKVFRGDDREFSPKKMPHLRTESNFLHHSKTLKAPVLESRGRKRNIGAFNEHASSPAGSPISSIR